ncbi:GPR1/FUN34/YaaH family transporter [Desulfitobacterium sp. THU1]|uniref:acetate uptake transporter family protein n=1 Tax=Desulfitobacterium sp. THU1 TaxID=3138072 RepID=UPI00311F0F82
MSNNQGGWANPSPAGLVALGVACFTFFALLSGKVTAGAMPLMACWLIGGFVVQVIVGVIELKEGQIVGGNVFLYFSAFFMLVGGLEFFVKYFAAIQQWSIPLDTHIDGWAWLVLSFCLVMWTPAYFKSTSILSLAVVLVDIAVVQVAFLDLGILDPSFKPIAGYALLFAGILAMYLSSALVVNTAYGKTIFPITKPWVTEKPTIIQAKM